MDGSTRDFGAGGPDATAQPTRDDINDFGAFGPDSRTTATTDNAAVGPAANVSQAGGLSADAAAMLDQTPGLGKAPAAGSVIGAGTPGGVAAALSGDTPVSQALGTASLGAPMAGTVAADQTTQPAQTGDEAILAAQQGMAKAQAAEDTSPLPADAPTPDQPAPVPGGINEGPPANMAGVPSNMNMKLAGNDFGPGTTILGIEVDGQPTSAPAAAATPAGTQSPGFETMEGFNDVTIPAATSSFNEQLQAGMFPDSGPVPVSIAEGNQLPSLGVTKGDFLGDPRLADATSTLPGLENLPGLNNPSQGLQGGNLTPESQENKVATTTVAPGELAAANKDVAFGPLQGDASLPGVEPFSGGKPVATSVVAGTPDPTAVPAPNVKIASGGFNEIDAAAGPAPAPAPGPTPDTKPAAGPAPTVQGGGPADTQQASTPSLSPDAASALDKGDTGGAGGGNAPAGGQGIPLASQLIQPIPGGDVTTTDVQGAGAGTTPSTPFTFPFPGLGDEGNPAGNFNPEQGLYAPTPRPGGPLSLPPDVLAALNNA